MCRAHGVCLILVRMYCSTLAVRLRPDWRSQGGYNDERNKRWR
jgi:hypothetical protein